MASNRRERPQADRSSRGIEFDRLTRLSHFDAPRRHERTRGVADDRH
jgi:hypothetical protein